MLYITQEEIEMSLLSETFLEREEFRKQQVLKFVRNADFNSVKIYFLLFLVIPILICPVHFLSLMKIIFFV